MDELNQSNYQALYFSGPRQVEWRALPRTTIQPGQVRVRTVCSGISAGTELLIYRNEMPGDMAADETLSALGGQLTYPLKYGYAVVGRVVELGQDVDRTWLNQLVFAFNPHETAFVATTTELYRVPDGLAPELAVLLPNVETALNFLQDGRPVAGEDVIVIGQGIVGQLTTALLARMPLNSLVTLDRYPLRRDRSLALGASNALDPAHIAALVPYQAQADLCYELSGAPAALNTAITLTGFGGRVIIGSWYGTKTAPIDLGGRFHRSRIQLISSQVSTLSPHLQTRWSKARRMTFALDLLQQLPLSTLITHRIPFSQAATAYQLLDRQPEQCLQIVLMYES